MTGLPRNVVSRRRLLYFRKRIGGKDHYLPLPPITARSFGAAYETAKAEMAKRPKATKFLPPFAAHQIRRWNARADKMVKLERLPMWATQIAREAYKRAKRKGTTFTLSTAQLHALVQRAGDQCEVSGLQFDHTRLGRGIWRPFAPSLDRIDNVGGYEYSNLRLVCVCVNVALNRWGDEVFWAMINACAGRMGQTAIFDEGKR